MIRKSKKKKIMHELSVALNIVDIAENEVRKAGARKVDEITIEVGRLTNIDTGALNFAWEAAVKNTVLEEAKRNMIGIPGKACCVQCGTDYELDNLYDACPNCHSFMRKINMGKDLLVKSLVVS
jgi:hydrogenase nickel incorporation protein HypA/HybF